MLYIFTYICVCDSTYSMLQFFLLFFLNELKSSKMICMHLACIDIIKINKGGFFLINDCFKHKCCFFMWERASIYLFLCDKVHQHCAFFLVNPLPAIIFVCCQFLMFTTIQPSADVALTISLIPLVRHANGLNEQLKTKALMLFRHYLL